MTIQFSKIGLIGKHAHPEVRSTAASLIAFLQHQGIEVILEKTEYSVSPDLPLPQASRDELGKHCDLIIVVGGDGSLLDASRAMVDFDVPLVGVNRGRRGFLTDISPQALTQSLEPILRGEFQEERRFLLEMALWRNNNIIAKSIALNEVTLYCGDIARMLEFELSIGSQHVYRQRSDGLIVATPTGSTAHALAGGGPIIHPAINAMVLVPMHPSVLSSRPIVIDANLPISLHLTSDSVLNPRISCDGQVHFDAIPNDKILIKRKAKELRLLHPMDYDYYDTLRTKLGWSA